MPNLLIHDRLREKMVRLRLKDEVSIARTVEILQTKFEGLKGRELVLAIGDRILEGSCTLGLATEKFGLTDDTPLVLTEKKTSQRVKAPTRRIAKDGKTAPLSAAAAGEEPLPPPQDLGMSDLDSVEAVTALEEQLDVLEAEAVEGGLSFSEVKNESPSEGVVVARAPVAPAPPARPSRPPTGTFSLEDDVASSSQARTMESSDETTIPVVRLPGGGVRLEGKREEPSDQYRSADLLCQGESDEGSAVQIETPPAVTPPRPVRATENAVAALPRERGERRITVRYHERMVAGRSFPLLVILSRKDPKIGPRDLPDATVAVVPLFPGSIVVPPARKVDLAGLRCEAAFWVTPLAGEGLADALVEIREGERLLATVPTPSRASRSRGPWFLALLGALLGATTLGAGLAGSPAGERLAPLLAPLGGTPAIGLVLSAVLLAAALLVVLARRPKEAQPRSGSL
ncbi:MAG: hypothetical protein HY720_08190 [Planctomycetes bacterium]|nr:hypothetical protein [Planctomycetota bacterium]